MYVDVGICLLINWTLTIQRIMCTLIVNGLNLKKGVDIFLDVPYPQYDVWRCEKCDRIYLFKENKVVKVYKPEE